MRFPLDTVWIEGGLRVVGVSANVPMPPPGVDDDAMPSYSPGVPQRYTALIPLSPRGGGP